MVTLTQSENGRYESPLTVTVRTVLRRFRGAGSVFKTGLGWDCGVISNGDTRREWHHTSSVWCHRKILCLPGWMCVRVGSRRPAVGRRPAPGFSKISTSNVTKWAQKFFKRHYSHSLNTNLWHYLTLLSKKRDSGWSAPHADPSLVTPWITSRGQCRSEEAELKKHESCL